MPSFSDIGNEATAFGESALVRREGGGRISVAGQEHCLNAARVGKIRGRLLGAGESFG
jgi:hypothetical protein